MDRIASAMPSMDFEWKDILKGTPLNNRDVSRHLQATYVMLLLTSACAAAGAWLSMNFSLVSMIFSVPILSSLVSLGLLFAIHASSGTTKIGLLAAFGAATGAGLGPIVSLAIELDPALIVTALALTLVLFATMSIIASVTSDRPMLWLGGLLGSALNWLLFAGFVNWFVGSVWLFMTIEVFGGLVLFALFVLFDTQLVLSRAEAKVERGETLTMDDSVSAAIGLFLDAVNIFVRILIILMRNQKKKERRRSSSS